MAKILITGGAGVMGSRLVKGLLEKGEIVRVLTLPGDPAAEKIKAENVEIFYGDISDKASLNGIMEDVKTVFHLAAILLAPNREELFNKINYLGSVNLIELSEEAGVEHFIYVSSGSVTYPKSNHYSRSKLAAEESLKLSRIPNYTIVRPTLAYENGGASEFIHFVEYLKKFPIIPFIGSGSSLKSLVFVEDIMFGLINIPGNKLSYGKTYNFCGPESMPIIKVAQMLLEHMGKKKMIVHIPIFICRVLSIGAMIISRITKTPPLLTWQTITGITQDLNLDIKSARDDLGYNPRPFSVGIKELTTLNNCLK